jgi:hypothetical protein
LNYGAEFTAQRTVCRVHYHGWNPRLLLACADNPASAFASKTPDPS